MTIQKTTTYMGYHCDSGWWAFSPSRIKNADFVWDISNWSFDQINDFMQLPDDVTRLRFLAGTTQGADDE